MPGTAPVVESGELSPLSHVDDADIARALPAAGAAQSTADIVYRKVRAMLLDERGQGEALHPFAVRADRVEVKAFDQIFQHFHAVCIYSMC